MRYTQLGSGTFILRKERSAAAHLVELQDRTRILMDCGFDAGLQMIRAGYPLSSLDAILITHPHADHLGGLTTILGSMHGADHYGFDARTKPLFLYGYPGFATDVQTLLHIMWPGQITRFPVSIAEFPIGQEITVGSALVLAREVPHTPHFRSLAFSVVADGRKLVYSGDCGMNSALVELADHADLFICENGIGCQEYADKGPQPHHLSAFECGQIASQAGVNHMVLTHLYDFDDSSTLLTAVRESFGGCTTVGFDLMQLDL